jgi:hypothetical protein
VPSAAPPSPRDARSTASAPAASPPPASAASGPVGRPPLARRAGVPTRAASAAAPRTPVPALRSASAGTGPHATPPQPAAAAAAPPSAFSAAPPAAPPRAAEPEPSLADTSFDGPAPGARPAGRPEAAGAAPAVVSMQRVRARGWLPRGGGELPVVQLLRAPAAAPAPESAHLPADCRMPGLRAPAVRARGPAAARLQSCGGLRRGLVGAACAGRTGHKLPQARPGRAGQWACSRRDIVVAGHGRGR